MIKKITAFFFSVCLFLIGIVGLLFLAAGAYLVIKDVQIGQRIYPNVFVNGVAVGGKTIDQVSAEFQTQNDALNKISLQLNYKDAEVATFSAHIIDLKYDTQTTITHAVSIGRSANFSSRVYQKIKAIFNFGRFDFPVTPAYDPQPLEDYLDSLEEKYNVPAENALFTFEEGKVTAFQPEKQGLRLQRDQALTAIDGAIKSLRKDANYPLLTITISDEIIQPEISLSSANTFGIVEEIGTGVSNFSGSIPGRIHNIILAASRLNGVLIPRDQVLSFNQTVGDISAATGYKPAYIIKSGRTVLGDGGGVCQVSTTLFRAGLNAGLPIVERVAHAYRVHYYENDSKPGFDATVFNPSTDLKIKNDTPAYILIQTTVDKNKNLLTFTLYGKKDGRSVEISNVRLWDVRSAPTPFYQDDPTLKRGVTRQVDWSAPGGKASFHYTVTRNKETLIDQDFFSSYRPWRAVFLVGAGE